MTWDIAEVPFATHRLFAHMVAHIASHHWQRRPRRTPMDSGASSARGRLRRQPLGLMARQGPPVFWSYT